MRLQKGFGIILLFLQHLNAILTLIVLLHQKTEAVTRVKVQKVVYFSFCFCRQHAAYLAQLNERDKRTCKYILGKLTSYG